MRDACRFCKSMGLSWHCSCGSPTCLSKHQRCHLLCMSSSGMLLGRWDARGKSRWRSSGHHPTAADPAQCSSSCTSYFVACVCTHCLWPTQARRQNEWLASRPCSGKLASSQTAIPPLPRSAEPGPHQHVLRPAVQIGGEDGVMGLMEGNTVWSGSPLQNRCTKGWGERVLLPTHASKKTWKYAVMLL